MSTVCVDYEPLKKLENLSNDRDDLDTDLLKLIW
jgi:hypothetical protein